MANSLTKEEKWVTVFAAAVFLAAGLVLFGISLW